MNIRHLEYLIALAETGSFSKAAERQFITQSALSRSIQGLEDELGCRLVDRGGKRNELTPLGREVVARSRNIVFDASELKRSVVLLGTSGGGALRVGLGSGPCALLMAPLQRAVAARYPDMKIVISRGPVDLQLLQLRSRQIDALVVDLRSVVPTPDLTIESMAELRAGFVARAQHPLAGRGAVLFDDLLAYPMASTPLSDEVARMLVDQFGPRANPAECVAIECGEIDSLIETVAQTDAVFLGIIAAARPGIDAGRLVELELVPPMVATARFGLITLAGRSEPPAMALLRQQIGLHLRD